ncbi:MAG: hypothetical protein FJY85_06220 [Deltaproteobacteria bacterium]|nr:hypothetical protein [Deltaproteobacteria bacterium]
MIKTFDVENLKIDIDRIDFERLQHFQERFTVDKQAIKERILASLKPGGEIKLTDDDKQLIEDLTRHAFAEILDIEPEKITRESHLVSDLGMDSLAFLEMFDEMKESLNLDIDVNVVARYAQEYPVNTFGEYLEQMYNFIEARDKILEQLGIDKEEVIQKIEEVIHKMEKIESELSSHQPTNPESPVKG